MNISLLIDVMFLGLFGVLAWKYLNLRQQVDHMDDWLYDHFSEDAIAEMASKEFYFLRKKEDDDESQE